jgi:hypothetical protein
VVAALVVCDSESVSGLVGGHAGTVVVRGVRAGASSAE